MRALACLLSLFFLSFPVRAAVSELPVEAFGQLPDVSDVSLSPDGKYIASVIRHVGKDGPGNAVVIYDTGSGQSQMVLTVDNRRYAINWTHWLNSRYLFISADYPSDRMALKLHETRLMIYDTKKNKLQSSLSKRDFRKMDFGPAVQDEVIDYLPGDEDHFLVQMVSNYPGGDSVYKVSISENSAELVLSNLEDTYDYITDRQHRIRLATQIKGSEIKIIHNDVDSKIWKALWTFESFGADYVYPIGFGQNPYTLYVQALHEGYDAIFKVDLSDTDLKKELVLSRPGNDLEGGIIYSDAKDKEIGFYLSGLGEIYYLDDTYRTLQASADHALKGQRNLLIGVSDDEKKYIVFSFDERNPGIYYLIDREKGSLKPLAKRYASLNYQDMAVKKVVSYTSRDGLEIEAVLTMPPGYEDGSAIPAIIFPHGGPHSFDGTEFDVWTQFFANRGYAVLQMNFRGSSGYGHEFKVKGLGRWGLEMQDDITDGTRWLISQDFIDPERVCIAGASYGGYAALMEAVQNPELYQCAVSIAGVTDMALLLKDSHYSIMSDVIKKQIGSDKSELRDRSPLYLAEKAGIPVLLMHGEKDRVVDVDHSRSMYKALKSHKKQVVYKELEDGTHHLRIEENRMAVFKTMDDFLALYLKKKE